MNKGLSPSRQMWNRVMTALVWASAVLVMVLVAGIIGMVLVRGIPSIIYGLVGMLVFSQALGFQTCLLSGSLTLVVMNLPTIIRTTQESLKTVPQGYREGAMGLGAGTVSYTHLTLPTICSV